MTVKELIERLQRVKNQDIPVWVSVIIDDTRFSTFTDASLTYIKPDHFEIVV